jgi:hypothetical protein
MLYVWCNPFYSLLCVLRPYSVERVFYVEIVLRPSLLTGYNRGMGRKPKPPAWVDRDGIEYYRCNKCGRLLPWHAFPERKVAACGIEGQCKECKAEYYHDYYRAKKRNRELDEEYIRSLEQEVTELRIALLNPSDAPNPTDV